MQLSLTHRERELYSLSVYNVYLRYVKHGPSVSSLFLEVDFFQTPPQLKSFQPEDLKHFFSLLPKFSTTVIIYFEKFPLIN